jgi:hypothetical protein
MICYIEEHFKAGLTIYLISENAMLQQYETFILSQLSLYSMHMI